MRRRTFKIWTPMHLNNARFRLLTLDLDGTLFKGDLVLYLNEKLGLSNEIKELHERYRHNEITEVELNILQTPILKKFDLLNAFHLLARGPLMKNLEASVEILKERGLQVGMLTFNPFQILFKEYGISCDISATGNYANGKITGLNEIPENKINFLEDYCSKEGISLRQCIHVGDGKNDIPTFRKVGLSIAVNTEDEDVLRSSTISLQTDDFMDVATAIVEKADSNESMRFS